jgi:hypothetical protein
MKKRLPAIIAFLCLPLIASAQIDTTVLVYAWKLDARFAKHIRTEVDTSLNNFQNYNPVYRNYTGAATLGNFGLPSQSIVFTERPNDEDPFFMQNFGLFIRNYRNTEYLYTRKPFSKLTYIKGGSSQTKEEIFDAFHSQNISKTINFGLHYTTVGSLGQYRFQNVKYNSFSMFSSHTGINYSYHFNFNWNKISADENGGIGNDGFITDTNYTDTKEIPTLFGGNENPGHHRPDVKNEIRNFNIFTIQEIALRKNPGNNDSTAKQRRIGILYPKIYYIFSFDRTLRTFIDKKPLTGYDAGLYRNIYINDELTSDSTSYWKLHNTARLQFQGKKGNFYFIDYSYELLNYALSTGNVDSASSHSNDYWFITDALKFPGLNYHTKLYNAFVSSSFNRNFADILELNLYGQLYLSGYRAGDFYLAGDIKLDVGKNNPISLLIRGVNELRTPEFLKTHYISNNYIWAKNFRQTIINHLSMNFGLSSKKFDIQGDYYLFRDVIYFNNEALPEQYNNNLSFISIYISKRFDFWKISSITKLAYQKSENDRVIGLPEIALFNSTYLKHLVHFKATGGKLIAMIGFDIFYNTKYYADAYMPALSSFYRQYDKQLGNYPYINVFLNVQLKRFRFFMEMDHLNSKWIDKNYFTVLHYPHNERDLKFGLSWTFYD